MQKISIFSVLALLVILFANSCKIKDDKAPSLFFSSDVELTQDWILQEYYTLPPATATDNVDGDVSDAVTITNNIVFYELRSDSIPGKTIYTLENKIKNGTKGFVGKAATYAIVYSATDEAGNVGTKQLTINVKNSLYNWAYNQNKVNVNYLISRTKLSSGGIGGIGGIYETTPPISQDWEYDNLDGVKTTLKPDASINYKIKISKIGNIDGLALSVNFNRFSNAVYFDNIKVIGKEISLSTGIATEYVYLVSIVNSGTNEYDLENNKFTITYQIERWEEQLVGTGDYEFEGRQWDYDKKMSFKETFMQE